MSIGYLPEQRRLNQSSYINLQMININYCIHTFSCSCKQSATKKDEIHFVSDQVCVLRWRLEMSNGMSQIFLSPPFARFWSGALLRSTFVIQIFQKYFKNPAPNKIKTIFAKISAH